MSKIRKNPLSWIGEDLKEEEQEENKQIRVNAPKKYEKSSKEGLPDKWTRATFIVKDELLRDLKDYAYSRKETIKDIVNEMIEGYLKDKDITERKDD